MILENTVKYGVIAGIVSLVLGVIVYLMGPEFLSSSMWAGLMVGALSLIVGIVLLIVLGTKIRNDNGGFIDFKTMFLNLFVVVALMVLIGGLFNLVLYQFIDPEFMEIAKENAIKNVGAFAENMSDEQYDQWMERMEEGFEQGVGKALKQILFSILGWGIFAAILSLILKKKDESFAG